MLLAYHYIFRRTQYHQRSSALATQLQSDCRKNGANQDLPVKMTSNSIQSPDALIESFPTPSLPVVQGEPTYPQLADIMKALKANAASIPSSEGGGTNGYLCS